MPSRMEKYYNSKENFNSRASRNSNLYNNLYDDVKYSNVEGVTTIKTNNQIDLEQIKQLLKEKDNDNLTRTVKKEKLPLIDSKEIEKNYDIRDVLNRAKDDYVDDNKNRSLKNTQYNILKNINIKDIASQDEEALKDLIHTITNSSVLNKLGDKDLSLDLLDNLKSNDNTMVGAYGTNEILKKIDEQQHDEDNLDKSFFTSSMNFGEKDFEELNDIKTSLKKNNILITVLVLVFLVIIGIIGFFLLYFI